jgi:hypothetical protein
MDEHLFPRPLPFLDENDPLIEHFWSLVENNDEINCLWLLAMNQVAAAYAGFVSLLPIGSPDPVRQKGVVFLHKRLQALRISPMDHLLERLQVHAPDLVRMSGRFLPYNVESRMLRFLRLRLGFPPEPPIRWRGEYLTRDNPIRVGPYIDGRNIVSMPGDVDLKYFFQWKAYVNAFRPVKRPGRRPIPPGATQPYTPRALDPQGIDVAYQMWRTGQKKIDIVRALWPDADLRDKRVYSKLLKRVDARIMRGRQHAEAEQQP